MLTQEGEPFRREIQIMPAFDFRNSDNKPERGAHGVEMRWHLFGSKGVVQFVLYTQWMPYQTMFQRVAQPGFVPGQIEMVPEVLMRPLPADIGYHSPVPLYEGQKEMCRSCPLLGTEAPCFYEGSGLLADDYFAVLCNEGGEALWEKLEAFYRETFEPEHQESWSVVQ